jgi:hypothetical protein
MQMKSISVYNDLWEYASGKLVKPEDAQNKAIWIIKDEKALAFITLTISISKAELGHIRKAV